MSMGWKGTLREKESITGSLREMSEPHDFNSADFKIGESYG